MNKSLKLFSFLFLIVAFVSCKKEDFNGISDMRPAVPVTVTNAIDFRPDPTVSTSLSGGGAIQISLSIPASSGRTIKEITRVAASTSFTQIQSTGTTGFYVLTPIAVNATTYTFNTSITEYYQKYPAGPAAAPNTELGRRFYFLITLDDDSTIISVPVRILVLA